MIDKVGDALLMAAGMFWQTGWSLVLGFCISSLLQAIVPGGQMQRAMGRGGVRQIALATLAGAASSSCSYASAAIMRTLFKKGAALVASLAFLFASTNLVIELGIILYLLLGWQFMVAEWIGGLVLIAVMSVLVKLTLPRWLCEEARHHEEMGGGHQHESMTADGETWRDRLRAPGARVAVAQNFAMEWRMLWKDLAAGFLIGGFVAAFVPDAVWRALFFTDAPVQVQAPLNAVIGPVVAMLTFVCSIGNVPLAAVLWAGGATFGGVLAFLYADLIVLPLLDIYRRYFGWRMAAYMGAIFFATMAIAALVMETAFALLDLVPDRSMSIRDRVTDFSLNYTFWLNMVALVVVAWLAVVNKRHSMNREHAHG
ncbi:permease [Sphingomonas sp. 1P08PE]|uniref:permease n=1 Tax=Sphingomonas sp. 1P08PE TaxID=554122 RepID=UPI0039A134BB